MYMYVYMYIYMYICIYMYISMYICMVFRVWGVGCSAKGKSGRPWRPPNEISFSWSAPPIWVSCRI